MEKSFYLKLRYRDAGRATPPPPPHPLPQTHPGTGSTPNSTLQDQVSVKLFCNFHATVVFNINFFSHRLRFLQSIHQKFMRMLAKLLLSRFWTWQIQTLGLGKKSWSHLPFYLKKPQHNKNEIFLSPKCILKKGFFLMIGLPARLVKTSAG